MKVKLYTCPFPFGGLLRPFDRVHPCARAYNAVRKAGYEIERIKVPMSRKKRHHVKELTGQRIVPVLELPDGTLIFDSYEIVRYAREQRSS